MPAKGLTGRADEDHSFWDAERGHDGARWGACVIVPEAVVRPVRSSLRLSPHATFRLGEVAGVNWRRRTVRLEDHG